MNTWSIRVAFKLLALVLIGSLLGCSSPRTYTPPANTTSANTSPSKTPITTETTTTTTATTNTIQTGTAEEGLDLQAVTQIAKTAKDAADLEKQLNLPDSVNNLDLDEDGKVDYIHVTEFKDVTEDTRGFSLTVDLGKNNIQEIATIILQKDIENNQRVRVFVTGNQEIYGDDDSYIGNWGYEQSPFATWAYSKHKYYASPYRYGVYPAGFVAFATVTVLVYLSKIEKNHQLAKIIVIKASPSTLINKPTLTSPNQGKTASNIKATLAKPNSTQQIFQTQNPSRAATRSSTYPGSSSSSSSRSTYPSSSSSSSSSRSTYPSSSSSSSKSSSSSSSSSRSSSSSSSSRRR